MEWTGVFQYAPGLVANIVIVWMLMNYLKHRDEQFSKALDEIENRHHEACKDTMQAIDNASRVVSENTRVIGRVEATLTRAVHRLDSA